MPPRAPGAGPSSFPLGPLTGGVGGLPLPTWPPLTATGARGPGDRAGQRGTRRPLGCDMGGLHLGPHVIATGPARPSGSSRPGGRKSSIPLASPRTTPAGAGDLAMAWGTQPGSPPCWQGAGARGVAGARWSLRGRPPSRQASLLSPLSRARGRVPRAFWAEGSSPPSGDGGSREAHLAILSPAAGQQPPPHTVQAPLSSRPSPGSPLPAGAAQGRWASPR